MRAANLRGQNPEARTWYSKKGLIWDLGCCESQCKDLPLSPEFRPDRGIDGDAVRVRRTFNELGRHLACELIQDDDDVSPKECSLKSRRDLGLHLSFRASQ